ncbi:hypothetical protein KOR42_06900 [Thalassoglobus neptunius]|uniref:Uncharacterized protein n=1 Tax=Thalassoglobus neptunius TaxID=1938619 RepID=A0A5C5X3A7_9PLAN|nr:hypothetical protein KOR42_06900 [Thalassoglobus neptunius]
MIQAGKGSAANKLPARSHVLYPRARQALLVQEALISESTSHFRKSDLCGMQRIYRFSSRNPEDLDVVYSEKLSVHSQL